MRGNRRGDPTAACDRCNMVNSSPGIEPGVRELPASTIGVSHRETRTTITPRSIPEGHRCTTVAHYSLGDFTCLWMTLMLYRDG